MDPNYPNGPVEKTKWQQMRWPVKAAIFIIPAFILGYLAYSMGWIPGLTSEKSMSLSKFGSDNSAINSASEADMLPLPNINNTEYAEMDNVPETRIMNWIWFGNAPIFTANGGNMTMKGSLMEKQGVRLKMITNNSVDQMKSEQLAFISKFAGGDKNPATGVQFVTLMGDGIPSYISAMNKQITKAYGKEYNLKSVGIVAFSLGEDCVMGPQRWLDNPQTMKGSVVSEVIGDGDWGLHVRFAADNSDDKGNSIKVNPDPDTYDAEAINVIPAPQNDFLLAAEDYIAGKKVILKVKDKNGRLTGETVEKVIEGCATWFPGDRNVVLKTDGVKIISTKQYPNQMATSLVGCDKWMKENSKTVVGLLSAALTAGNQIKSYDSWFKYACELAPKVFYANPKDATEQPADWYTYARAGGSMKDPNGKPILNQAGQPVSIGGTQMANLSDAKKYFGLKGGNDYYKSVYTYFSDVIKTLNPCGFMNDVGEVTSYEDAIDLSYLKQVNVDAGTITPIDYDKNEGKVFAKKSWKIEFAIGSAAITPAGEKELEKLFAQLNTAENAAIEILGHTDDTGTPDGNLLLSVSRAKAVKLWLIQRSGNTFPDNRFRRVDGVGSSRPVDPNADNTSKWARAQNRRVEISLMQ